MKGNKPHIAFVAAVPGFNIFNRKSAIDSILCSLLLELSAHYDITVNGASFETLKQRHFKIVQQPVTALSSTSFIKSLIPRRLKLFIKEKRDSKNRKVLCEELKTTIKTPDLIFELYKYGSTLGSDLSGFFKTPLLVYYDAPEVEQYIEIHRVRPVFAAKAEAAERQNIKNADGVVVYSTAVKKYLVKNTGSKEEKFYVFQTLDYTRLTFTAPAVETGVLNIGYIGSFMRWHKVERLVEMFNRLCTENYHIRLLLVGAGEAYQEVKKKVAESPYAHLIDMPGFIDGESLLAYKQKMHIGLMPGSRWYNIPTKVFEYGAASIASIAPQTHTINDIFTDGKDIVLFDNEKDETLYQALKKLLDNETLRVELAARLNDAMRTRFTAQGAADFYRNIIGQLLIQPQ